MQIVLKYNYFLFDEVLARKVKKITSIENVHLIIMVKTNLKTINKARVTSYANVREGRHIVQKGNYV